MDLFDLFGLLTVGLAAGLWLGSLRVRETAVAAVKMACASEQLLLLDDTVSIKNLWLTRDTDGVACFRRTYSFEYSDTGNDRVVGTATLLGNRLLSIELNLRVRSSNPTLH